MLDEGAGLARVVDAGLQDGWWVQSVLPAKGEGAFIGREAVGKLCPNSCVAQFAHLVVVSSSKAVSPVVPARESWISNMKFGKALQ